MRNSAFIPVFLRPATDTHKGHHNPMSTNSAPVWNEIPIAVDLAREIIGAVVKCLLRWLVRVFLQH